MTTTTDPTLQTKIAADDAAIVKDGGPPCPPMAPASACRDVLNRRWMGRSLLLAVRPLGMESVLTTHRSPGRAGKNSLGWPSRPFPGVIDVGNG